VIWPNELFLAQEEVARYANEYYRTMYRPQEAFYWSYVPQWMDRDWLVKPPKRALDIGCGWGTLMLYTRRANPQCEIYGIDFKDGYCPQELFQKRNLQFAVSDIELEDPPWTGPFDMIVLTEVLEHFNYQPIPTLQRIRRLLSENGVLYLATTEAETCGRTTKYYSSLAALPPVPVEREYKHDAHIWQFDKIELLAVLENSGFRVTRFEFAPGVGGRRFNLSAVPK
jgi:cyclopropane fatty-acyl-phospholipid synthase-like methyltransferase